MINIEVIQLQNVFESLNLEMENGCMRNLIIRKERESETNYSSSYHETLSTIPALVSSFQGKFIYLSIELMVVQVSNYKTSIKEYYSRSSYTHLLNIQIFSLSSICFISFLDHDVFLFNVLWTISFCNRNHMHNSIF